MEDTQHTLPHDEAETFRTADKIPAKEFKVFGPFLKIIENDFLVFHLVGGVFRASSYKCACVVEAGFRLFGDMHCNILEMQDYIKAIFNLLDKETCITVAAADSSIILEDNESSLLVFHRDPVFSDNDEFIFNEDNDEFIFDEDEEEEIKETLLDNEDPNKLIVSEAIPKIADDISIIHEDNVPCLQLSLSGPLYSTNKFISDEEMIETFLNNVDPNKLIVSEAIPKIKVLEINKTLRIFGLDRIHVKHDENDLSKGFLSLVKESGGLYNPQIELKKPLLIPMKKNHYFKLEILPTLFNKDDMYLKCYLTNDQKIFSMYSTKVNDLFVNIYSVSELIEESEEEYYQRFITQETPYVKKSSKNSLEPKGLSLLFD